ncbi:LLM class flavin-dependent oxidoreductase [Actinomadura rugatobispora]|uniref:LLM class flavin-dependent oxidoreductase n=1 Tax=Actinomadura rugatobispora TaxID=1994 RepID=A0ABW1A5S9_9ACTN|nr:LLM class flavin-dependent oxidoreductase [Actinomadura rugatobispora]
MTSIGITIPQRASLFGVGTVRELLGLAPLAEETGLFDTAWVGDSLTSKARPDALACLGVLAGTTSALRLGAGCMASFAVRDPALFAYQWASLDVVSEGRTLLAVCNGLQKKGGASEEEGRHFGGVPDRERVARLEEYIGLVRRLWTGDPVDFEGRFARYDGIRILPAPVQDPCPIWISANPPAGPHAARVLRRVATRADGLLTSRGAPGYVAALRAGLDAELRAAGRDPGPFPIGVYHSVNIGPDREECLAEARRFFDNYYGEGVFDRDGALAMTAVGSPEECAEQLRAVRDEGASHISLRLASWRPREQFDLLVEKVLPAFLAD